ncbi:MAG: hypothetical protein DF168_01088 [Candidatus Moanabacter tarae]|uniref:Uncharacterized protein n=1 Tax=Candidatus Moanibacter tarae TaxID=2200854 RepID=A0A2Z4AD32_9BACT|nr:MAG: hypothetical protein DF168_01088 [Candidatus Moanabacter tarae]
MVAKFDYGADSFLVQQTTDVTALWLRFQSNLREINIGIFCFIGQVKRSLTDDFDGRIISLRRAGYPFCFRVLIE